MKRIIYNTFIFFLPCIVLATGCKKTDSEDRMIRNVCIIYSAGYNNLSKELTANLEDMETKGYIPSRNGRDVLLVISQRTAKDKDYETPTAPCLYRIFKQSNRIVKDTLFALSKGSSLLEPESMRILLGKARDLFPADHYGMVFSSHGSGWLPAGFYTNPDQFQDISEPRHARRIVVPDIYLQDAVPDKLRTKAIGAEFYMNPTDPEEKKTLSKEMDIEDMAAAIPMHLDYLLFDACLMGGIEVAWTFREVADYIGFSQAEILSEGFNYTTLTEHLLRATPAPEAVCKDFYDYHEKQSGVYHSSTISLVRTDALEALALACRPLFETLRTTISELKASDVQGFGGDKRYFYDLMDILEKACAPAEGMARVRTALDNCAVFKATTGQYYSMHSGTYGGTVSINAFCGLTMYLPSPSAVSTGKAYLDAYYRDLGWNKAAGLMK